LRFGNERRDALWRSAVDADGEHLRRVGDGGGAFAEWLAMRDVECAAASEGDPGRGGWRLPECAEDSVRFLKGGDGFEGEEVSGCCGEDRDALGVEGDEVVEADGVAAMVFGSVVECGAVRAEGGGDPGAAIATASVCGACLFGESDGLLEGAGGVVGRAAEFAIAEAGDLVAGGGDAVGAGAQVIQMQGDDGFRGGVENVRRPERTGNVAAAALEFGGEASVEDADGGEVDGGARGHGCGR